MLDLTAIVAISDSDRGIGKNNDLPWSLTEDWKYFLRFIGTTRDKAKINALIMGRKTWESIPEGYALFQPCLVVIISSSLEANDLKEVSDKPVLIAKSFDLALDLLNSHQYTGIVEKIISCGGTSIYRASFESSHFKRLYLTRVFGDFECDVFMEPAQFLRGLKKVGSDLLGLEMKEYGCEYNVMKKDAGNGIEYIFEVHQKI